MAFKVIALEKIPCMGRTVYIPAHRRRGGATGKGKRAGGACAGGQENMVSHKEVCQEWSCMSNVGETEFDVDREVTTGFNCMEVTVVSN